jgi:hypothetical protein
VPRAFGTAPGGGMMTHPMSGQPSVWLPYVLVDDSHAAAEKARGLGAQVIREPMAVMDIGWLSVILDPTGAALGMWQAKMPGTRLRGPGCSPAPRHRTSGPTCGPAVASLPLRAASSSERKNV